MASLRLAFLVLLPFSATFFPDYLEQVEACVPIQLAVCVPTQQCFALCRITLNRLKLTVLSDLRVALRPEPLVFGIHLPKPILLALNYGMASFSPRCKNAQSLVARINRQEKWRPDGRHLHICSRGRSLASAGITVCRRFQLSHRGQGPAIKHPRVPHARRPPMPFDMRERSSLTSSGTGPPCLGMFICHIACPPFPAAAPLGWRETIIGLLVGDFPC